MEMPEPKIDVPPHVAEAVHAIALLHAEHHRKSTLAERIVDRQIEQRKADERSQVRHRLGMSGVGLLEQRRQAMPLKLVADLHRVARFTKEREHTGEQQAKLLHSPQPLLPRKR